jgi:HD superfamily phosphohydrolase
VRDESVYKALLAQPLRPDEFLEMDDITVMHCFKIWSKSDDAILAKLCNGLLFRNVYKSIDLSRVADPDRAAAIVKRAESAVADAGGDSTYEVFYDELAETGYEVPIAGDPDSPSEILIVDPTGHARDFAQISPLVQALNQQLMFRRLHVTAEYRDLVQKAITPLL